jgi:2-polyprenyl-3-methyl-5-hydroxy-6-metoxy-1,4-benzoquinol methylase
MSSWTLIDESFFLQSIRDGFAGWYKAGHLRRQITCILRQCQPAPRSVVLDVACGHGKHAALLARRRYRVVATDISASLIAHLHAQYGKQVTFEKRSFAELDYVKVFDLVIVLGNSLGLIS